MSQLLINEYLNELATLKRVSGANRESVVREAFKDLLKKWGKTHNLHFIPEHEFITTAKVRNYVDGALMHDLRVPFGYWEAKDEADDLDAEIEKKFRRGYPNTNIIFEDSTQAVLIQNGVEVIRCKTEDGAGLQNLLELFFGWQRPEIAEFRKAIVQFKADLPAVLVALRARIDDAYASNDAFKTAAADFLKQARSSINPSVTANDVREMLIQHILTEDIFARVFGNDDFHRENNVAKALHMLDSSFWKGDVKRQTLAALEPYYAAIRSTAALISSHSEKQGFLKAIYENFYKVYNPKAADKLGVVYTPNEIVRFMVESTDWLCEKHFKKSLIDRDVNILDPATGTGTFIVELMEHFRGRPEKLAYKYLTELYANEVAILPYYVANLNIEATYAAIVGKYEEFPGLCFVDTLDNVAALGAYSGQQHEMFGTISDENSERVRRQNTRRISVVIGNPPYNANQKSENEKNKNREYKSVDKRIRDTYVKLSSAKKTKRYDMYSRFFRWATDRLSEPGIVALITNRNFIDSREADGFRKSVHREFDHIYVVDLGGDVRADPTLSGTTHNVFGIQTGVAITFLVRDKGTKARKAAIRYVRRPQREIAEEKLSWLSSVRLAALSLETIQPDTDGNWLDPSNDQVDWGLRVASEVARSKRGGSGRHTIFHLYSNGINTARDSWVFDRSASQLREKEALLLDLFNENAAAAAGLEGDDLIEALDERLKWSEGLIAQIPNAPFVQQDVAPVAVTYRPFTRLLYLPDPRLSDRLTSYHFEMFGPNLGQANPTIMFSGKAATKPFSGLATSRPFGFDTVEKTQAVTRYRYVGADRLDNITDWALKQFTARYGKAAAITKDDIFAYVYAVLHDPVYRETYALNLKREFPRIPLYPDFKRWRDWGQALLDLHIGYETALPAALTRTDAPDPKRAEGTTPVVKLKSNPDNGIIMLDADTQLSGVPTEAWRYRLGNRSAIDWVLDQHKEKTSKDPTVREKFNNYRFADYKDAVIDLLARVVTVSVETVKITDAMSELPASSREQKKVDT